MGVGPSCCCCCCWCSAVAAPPTPLNDPLDSSTLPPLSGWLTGPTPTPLLIAAAQGAPAPAAPDDCCCCCWRCCCARCCCCWSRCCLCAAIAVCRCSWNVSGASPLQRRLRYLKVALDATDEVWLWLLWGGQSETGEGGREAARGKGGRRECR